MAIVSTGLNEYGVKSEFFRRLDSQPTHYLDLCTKVDSQTDKEKYRWVGPLPQVREWGTGRMARGVHSESFDVDNLKYELTCEIDRDEVSDDQTGQIMLRINEMAARAATHKDYLLALLLANGEAADALGYDGKPFFATDHESGDSGAQDNKLDFDVDVLTGEPNTPDRPGVATLQCAFDEALSALLGFKDSAGQPMALSDRGLYVVCHSSLKIRWLTALQAAFVGSTQNVRDQMDVKIISFPWLTDKSKWYLLKCDEPTRPLIFQSREPIEFKLLGPGSEREFLQDKWLAGVRARYTVTYGRWEYAVRTDFV